MERKGAAKENAWGEIAVTGPLITCSLFRFQGVVPTAQRAAIVVGVELPVYDITKKHLILSGIVGDTILAHFM